MDFELPDDYMSQSKPNSSPHHIVFKGLVSLLSRTTVQKIFGDEIVFKVFRVSLIAWAALRVFYAPFSSLPAVVSYTFALVDVAVVIWAYYKFKELVALRDNPMVGIKLITSDGQIPAIFNGRWVLRYKTYFYVFLVIDLVILPSMIVEFQLRYIISLMSEALLLLIIFPLINLLYYENPKSSIYADAKVKAKSMVEKTKEALAPKPELIPIRVT